MMFRSFFFSFFHVCLLIPIVFLSPPTIGQVYQSCDTTANYTDNIIYESNLKLLLSSLASNTSNSVSGGFLNTTVGQIPNQIDGLAMCRGDKNASACRSCLSGAIQDAPQLCPYNKGAVVIYDDCLLRYSYLSFFSKIDTSMKVYMWNKNNVTDRSLFDEIRNELMNSITDWAIYNSTRRFAIGETINSTKISLSTIYGLVQCTQDLSRTQCQQCLQSILMLRPTQLEGKQGGRVVTASCNYRYESYKFYDGVSTLRLEPSVGNAPAKEEEGKKENVVIVVLAITIPLVTVCMVIFILCLCFQRKKPTVKLPLDRTNLKEITSIEPLLISISTLRVATADFFEENKLGQGGFGAVYKGLLPDGQEIAVKRLSTSSSQGFREMRNELVSIAKLQHKNLVRLLGVCLEEQEKLLVYEYLPNRSLDNILFDPTKCDQLNWRKRYKIIDGIARGILYLHQDSQLKVIHRDLKASNILLDANLNPKISDFGMAKLFGRDQTQSTTNRIVGTFGYMAPEYVMHGQCSTKSDVYSFGILFLEIVTGKKNSDFSNSEYVESIPSYVWKHWIRGTILETLDPSLGNHCPRSEVLKCIQIGLLCIQQNPSDRPNMSQVVVMLNSNSVSLQTPSKPAFCFENSGIDREAYSLRKSIPMPPHEVSITELEPR